MNSSIDYSGHRKQWMPTIEETRRSIPIWAKWFACEDAKDAFEHVILDEEDWHMLTVAPPIRLKPSDFTNEEPLSWGHSAKEIAAIRELDALLLQWRHCPQGLLAIAPLWNVFLSHGLNAIFRNEWLSWMACFVDDLLIFSWSEDTCKQRQRLIPMALQKLNLRVSDNLDRTVRQEGHLVGLKFVPGVVVVSDEAADALKTAMQMEVKNMKDARHLIGILAFAQAAFEWDLTHMTWYAERMAVMNESTTQPKFV